MFSPFYIAGCNPHPDDVKKSVLPVILCRRGDLVRAVEILQNQEEKVKEGSKEKKKKGKETKENQDERSSEETKNSIFCYRIVPNEDVISDWKLGLTMNFSDASQFQLNFLLKSLSERLDQLESLETKSRHDLNHMKELLLIFMQKAFFGKRAVEMEIKKMQKEEGNVEDREKKIAVLEQELLKMSFWTNAVSWRWDLGDKKWCMESWQNLTVQQKLARSISCRIWRYFFLQPFVSKAKKSREFLGRSREDIQEGENQRVNFLEPNQAHKKPSSFLLSAFLCRDNEEWKRCMDSDLIIHVPFPLLGVTERQNQVQILQSQQAKPKRKRKVCG